MSKIEWKITEQNLSQELVSTDNRWHISKKQKGESKPEFFLSQWELILMPHGTGSDYRECFETFITDCDEFVKKVAAIQSEAKAHLQALVDVAKEIDAEPGKRDTLRNSPE